jgi:hypothetical protein
MMLFVTYARGASPHDIFFSCSSPFLIWGTLIFVTCLRSGSARVSRTCTTAACQRTNDKEWGRCTSRSADGFFCAHPCSCYTTEFMLAGDKSDSDRFVYDPRKRTWIPLPHTPRGVHAAPE